MRQETGFLKKYEVFSVIFAKEFVMKGQSKNSASGWSGSTVKGSAMFPSAPDKQGKNWENLQPAGQHTPGQHEGAEVGVNGEITRGTDGLETGANVVKSTHHGGEIGSDGVAIQRNDQENTEENGNIRSQIGVDIVQDLLVYRSAIDADDLYLFGIDALADIPAQYFEQQQQPGNLHATAGGTGTGAGDHQKQ